MEMPEQEVHNIYSQMLQMFPGLPQQLIWHYVQNHSTDIEKCVQMLNYHNVTVNNLRVSSMDNEKKVNDTNQVQSFPIILLPENVGVNNNNVNLNNECHEQTSYDSHSSYSTSLVSPDVTHNSDASINCYQYPSVAVNEPLKLDIIPDDEGITHSWRPSNSDDMLCTNIFVPSPVDQNLQPRCQIPNWNLKQNHLEFNLNPRTINIESGRCNSMTAQMLYNYPLPDWKNSSKDITSYLHYQKSQMNAVKYEVIKAKIELSDLKDSVENLDKELKEKLQSKSAQDIIDLNKEIEQLRLDCQCLFSEIDDSAEDPSAQSSNIVLPVNSNDLASTDIQDESNKWQCPNCTFVNHPDINVCEMCQLRKSVIHRPSFLPTPPSSCYCHPRESTLPIQS